MSTPFPIMVGAYSDLLLVRADAPMCDALQEASDALESAIAIILAEASNGDAGGFHTSKLYGAATLIQLAKGLTDATIVRAEHEDRQGGRHG